MSQKFNSILSPRLKITIKPLRETVTKFNDSGQSISSLFLLSSTQTRLFGHLQNRIFNYQT